MNVPIVDLSPDSTVNRIILKYICGIKFMFVHGNSCRWTVGRYFFHGASDSQSVFLSWGVGRFVGKNVSVGIDLYRRHFYRQIVSVGVALCRPMVGRYRDF